MDCDVDMVLVSLKDSDNVAVTDCDVDMVLVPLKDSDDVVVLVSDPLGTDEFEFDTVTVKLW